MADEDDFCGGRLRLTALLRMAENMPERPARFRRRLVEGIMAADTTLTENIPDQEASPMEIADNPGPEVHWHVSSASGVIVSQLELDTDSARSRQSLSRRASGGTLNSPERLSVVGPARTPLKKKPIVYSSKVKKKSDGRSSRGARSARRKRMPVKGLALIRTSTEDALPELGDAEVRPATPITDTDPIEDIQAIVHQTTTQRSSHRISNQPKGTGRGRKVLMRAHRSRPHGLRIARPNASGRSRRPRELGIEALTDGFEGLELSLPSKTCKTLSKTKRGTINQVKPDFAIDRSLQLGSGLLPTPSPLPSIPTRPTMMKFSLNASQHNFSSMVPAPGIDSNVEDAHSLVYAPQASRTAVAQRAHASHTLATQFSTVTAPAREDSDSESESCGSDQGLDDGLDQYGAGDEYEGSDTSGATGEVDYGPVASYCAQANSGYFEDAIFHLDTPEDRFWTHYGGLE